MSDHNSYLESSITKETAEFNDELKALLSDRPRVWQVPVDTYRQDQRKGLGIFPAPIFSDRAYWRSIPGRDGPIKLRIVPPASGKIASVYLRIHGGGWTFGGADFGEPFMEELSDALGAVVISVEYRLAPEHAFPAGPNDCEDAANWLLQNAAAEFGTDAMYIGGDSAGAHLSVLTLLRLRDRHGATGFRAANLLYGCYDLSGTPSLLNWGDENLVLDTPTTFWFFDNFVPVQGDRQTPSVSPLYADLSGLPPALFTVGTLDPILDDSLFMYQRWQAAANPAELAVYPGGVHGFNNFPITIGAEANHRSYEFLRRYSRYTAN